VVFLSIEVSLCLAVPIVIFCRDDGKAQRRQLARHPAGVAAHQL
jgi:hypothetical protein